MKNIIEKITYIAGKINRRYDATAEDIVQIVSNSKSQWDLICYSFRYGYMQGYKAALAEHKKNK